MYALNIGLQGVQPLGADGGLADPLRTATAIAGLIRQGTEAGLHFRLGTDFSQLARLRRELRDSDVCPLFDQQICRGLSERGFWMSAEEPPKKKSPRPSN